MKKIMLIITIPLFCSTAILSNGDDKVRQLKSKITKELIKTDTKKFEKYADALIADFFSSSNVSLQDVVKEMKSELIFKKDILVKKLEELDKQDLDDKTKALNAQKLTVTIFEAFVKRIKYIRISEWNNSLVKAINEKGMQNAAKTRSSYPELDPNKRHLLAKCN